MHQHVIFCQSAVERVLAQSIGLGDEGEVLLGGVEVDEETAIDKRACRLLPRRVFADAAMPQLYRPFGGFDEVKHQAHQGGLSCTVVTHESHQFALLDGQFWNIKYGVLAILLDKVVDSNFHILIVCNVRNIDSGAVHRPMPDD